MITTTKYNQFMSDNIITIHSIQINQIQKRKGQTSALNIGTLIHFHIINSISYSKIKIIKMESTRSISNPFQSTVRMQGNETP